MADNDPSLLASLTRSMHALSDRQQVIARNIANSETAGFKAGETPAQDFSSLLAAHGNATTPHVARPRVTITSGMAALGARQPGGGVIADPDTSETKLDGNNIVLEEQLLKMSGIQSDFAAVTNIYKKQMGFLKIATARGG